MCTLTPKGHYALSKNRNIIKVSLNTKSSRFIDFKSKFFFTEKIPGIGEYNTFIEKKTGFAVDLR